MNAMKRIFLLLIANWFVIFLCLEWIYNERIIFIYIYICLYTNGANPEKCIDQGNEVISCATSV